MWTSYSCVGIRGQYELSWWPLFFSRSKQWCKSTAGTLEKLSSRIICCQMMINPDFTHYCLWIVLQCSWDFFSTQIPWRFYNSLKKNSKKKESLKRITFKISTAPCLVNLVYIWSIYLYFSFLALIWPIQFISEK